MNIAILAETRQPTRPYGSNGAGRVAWDVAVGLRDCGHDVTLSAAPGSEVPGGVALAEHRDEHDRALVMADMGWPFDALFDLTHDHDLSRLKPDAPVVNFIADTEFTGSAPNTIAANAWLAGRFPSARIVPLGLDVDAYPLVKTPEGYAIFAAKLHHAKGWDVAMTVARLSGMPLVMIGPNMTGLDVIPPDVTYLGEVTDNAVFLRWLSEACVLLAPYRNDAGSRVVLEAAACGTPALVMDGTGTASHVEPGVSGVVCRDIPDMMNALWAVDVIDRAGARIWCKREHDMPRMIDGVERALVDVARGERW